MHSARRKRRSRWHGDVFYYDILGASCRRRRAAKLVNSVALACDSCSGRVGILLPEFESLGGFTWAVSHGRFQMSIGGHSNRWAVSHAALGVGADDRVRKVTMQVVLGPERVGVPYGVVQDARALGRDVPEDVVARVVRAA